MTFLVDELQRYVGAVCRERFPDSAAICEFVPLADPALGHLGSDILQRIAGERRVSPASIAQEIVDKFEGSAFGLFRVVDDYLNITLSDSALLGGEIPFRDPRPCTVAVMPRRRELDPIAFARILSSASLQWFLGNRKGTLLSCAGALQGGSNWEQFKGWFIRNLDLPADVAERDEAELLALLDGRDKEPLTVWLYPDFLTRSRFRSFTAAIRGKVGADFTVQCPDREQVTRISESLSIRELERESADTIAAFVVYLSRPGAGLELDLSVPRYGERTNLKASLSMLHQRVSRWSLSEPAPLQGVTLSEAERLCLSRARLIPLFRERAVSRGFVAELLQAIEQMISLVTRYLNDPAVRMTLDRSAAAPVTSAIIAGVTRSTSDIINSCLPFQDLGPIRQ